MLILQSNDTAWLNTFTSHDAGGVDSFGQQQLTLDNGYPEIKPTPHKQIQSGTCAALNTKLRDSSAGLFYKHRKDIKWNCDDTNYLLFLLLFL